MYDKLVSTTDIGVQGRGMIMIEMAKLPSNMAN